MRSTEVILSEQTFVGLEDVLKTYLEDVLKTSLEDVLKTSLEDVLKTYLEHYGKKQNTYWGYLYQTNLNVYLTNLYNKSILHKSISGNSKVNPNRTQASSLF